MDAANILHPRFLLEDVLWRTKWASDFPSRRRVRGQRYGLIQNPCSYARSDPCSCVMRIPCCWHLQPVFRGWALNGACSATTAFRNSVRNRFIRNSPLGDTMLPSSIIEGTRQYINLCAKSSPSRPRATFVLASWSAPRLLLACL